MQALALLRQRCLTVRLSVTLWLFIKTNKASVMISSPTESKKTLVFADIRFSSHFEWSHPERALNGSEGMRTWSLEQVELHDYMDFMFWDINWYSPAHRTSSGGNPKISGEGRMNLRRTKAPRGIRQWSGVPGLSLRKKITIALCKFMHFGQFVLTKVTFSKWHYVPNKAVWRHTAGGGIFPFSLHLYHWTLDSNVTQTDRQI